MNFEDIFAEASPELRAYESIEDPVKDLILDCIIHIYGVPECENDEDDFPEEVYNGGLEGAVEIGEVTGVYVLGSQFTKTDYDIHLTCDDHDAYSEFIVSALTEDGGPMADSFGEIETLDLFCINEVILNKVCDTEELKLRIIQNLPHFLLGLYHHNPDLLAVCPAALPYEKPAYQKVKEDMAQIAFRQTQESILGADKKDDQEIQFILDEEQQNYILGRRNPGQSYPESAKDPEQWQLYEKAGFIEHGRTRVLFKELID